MARARGRRCAITGAGSDLRTLPRASAEDADALALWTMHAHCHQAADVSPIQALTSPEKRCGKTRTLTLLGRLVPKPLPTANITAAALFRSVEKWRPTLLIDEGDSFLRDNEDLRGVLNSGPLAGDGLRDPHRRRGSRASPVRNVGSQGDRPDRFAARHSGRSLDRHSHAKKAAGRSGRAFPGSAARPRPRRALPQGGSLGGGSSCGARGRRS